MAWPGMPGMGPGGYPGMPPRGMPMMPGMMPPRGMPPPYGYPPPGYPPYGMMPRGMPPMMPPRGMPPQMPPTGMPPAIPPAGLPPSVPAPAAGAAAAPAPAVAPPLTAPPQQLPSNLPALAPEPPQAPVSMYVGRLPEGFADSLVQQLLRSCGTMLKWKRAGSPAAGFKRFGYVEYAHPRFAQRALDNLDGLMLADSKLLVKVSSGVQKRLADYAEESKKRYAGAATNPFAAEEETCKKGVEAVLQQVELDRQAKEEERLRELELDKAERAAIGLESKGRGGDMEDPNRTGRILTEIDKFRIQEKKREEDMAKRKVEMRHLALKRAEQEAAERKAREEAAAAAAEAEKQAEIEARRKARRGVPEAITKRSGERSSSRSRHRHKDRRSRSRRHRHSSSESSDGRRHRHRRHGHRRRRSRSSSGGKRSRSRSPHRRHGRSSRSRSSAPAPKVKMALSLKRPAAAPKPAAKPAVFGAAGFGPAAEGKKQRELIPLDYTEEERLAVLPQEAFGAAQAAAKVAAKLAAQAAQKSLQVEDVQEKIANVPKNREGLFAYPVDWASVDRHRLVEGPIKAVVTKAIVEFLGEAEPTMVEFVLTKIGEHTPALALVKELEPVLDDDAPTFVEGVWRNLVVASLKTQISR